MSVLGQWGGASMATTIGGIVGTLIVLGVIIVVGQALSLFVQSLLSDAGVGLWEIVTMRLRRVDVRQVVYARIRAVKAGLFVGTRQIETHHLAGGDVRRVISAMIVAKSAGMDLPWEIATARDLSGHDVFAEESARAGTQGHDHPDPEARRPASRRHSGTRR